MKVRAAAVVLTNRVYRDHKKGSLGFLFCFLSCRTSNLEPRTSNLEPRTSNLEPRTSNLEPRTSNLEPLLNNVVVVFLPTHWPY
ncbi:hypothetical protein C0W35_08190 [Photobacterium kishitanii]|nr:hypothetical protein C0W35_08190 [Photobacterium kishitanii]